jgi:glucosyl-dolichyl phosphate glucuronosyltransferase
LLDYGDTEQGVQGADRLFYGANFSVRRDIFDKVGLFNTNLGRKGSALLGGEEVDLQIRMAKTSEVIIYNPEICVIHKIEAERVTKKYFRRWYTYSGRSLAEKIGLNGRSLFRVPLWVWRSCLGSLYNWFKSALVLRSADAFYAELNLRRSLAMMMAIMKGREPRARADSHLGP